jgi:hypothetical protein
MDSSGRSQHGARCWYCTQVTLLLRRSQVGVLKEEFGVIVTGGQVFKNPLDLSALDSVELYSPVVGWVEESQNKASARAVADQRRSFLMSKIARRARVD